MSLRRVMLLVAAVVLLLPMTLAVLSAGLAEPPLPSLRLEEGLAGSSARLLDEDLRRTAELFRIGTRLFDLPTLSTSECLGALRLLYKQDSDVDLVVLLDGADQAVVEPVFLTAEQVAGGGEAAGRLPVSAEHLKRFLRRLPRQQARAQQLAFSEPYADLPTNSLLLAGAISVPLGEGEPTWVLGFERSLRRPQRLLSTLAAGIVSRAFVVDDGGRVVVHPEGRCMLERELLQEHPLVKSALEGAKRGSSDWRGPDGRRLQGAFARLDLVGWTLVVEHEAADRAASALPWWTFAGWAALAALVGICLIWLERRVRQVLGEREALRRSAEQRAEELKRLQASMIESGKLSAIGDLGAGVAHELNNPLGGIMGLAQLLLRKKKADDPDRNFLQRIEDEARRCKAITDNLLRFSEKQSLDLREPVRIERVLDVALDLVTRKLESQRIRIEKNYRPHLPRVLGHDGQLQRAFLNVLLNADTAMPGGGTLTVSTGVEAGRVVVRISDTGAGIPAENLERVFEPFFTTKANWKGAGLGLTEVYQIVKAHGGEVLLDSQAGRGTEVTFFFPAETGRPAAQ